jgi:hypothetical protein
MQAIKEPKENKNPEKLQITIRELLTVKRDIEQVQNSRIMLMGHGKAKTKTKTKAAEA